MQEMSHSKYLTPTSRILEDVLRATKPLDVQFVIQDLVGGKRDIIDEIYKSVSRTLPTSCISLNETIPTELPSFRAHCSTLIIYVYVSKTTPDVRGENDIVRVIIYDDNRPKVLLITVLEEENNDFESLLKEMWRMKILHAMILELSESNGDVTAMRIHQYNPFINVYDRHSYSSSTRWFSNEMTNLHGYPIRVHITLRLGHAYVRRSKDGYPLYYRGTDVKFLNILSRTLNFTVVMVPSTEVLAPVKEGAAEFVITSLPLIVTNYTSDLAYTLPVKFEKWCPTMFVTYNHKTYMARAFVGIILNYVIVFIIWVTSILMKFDLNQWQPLKIFGLIIFISVPMKPMAHAEKIMFIVSILVSYIYTSNLYADLTTAYMYVMNEVEYKNFEEFDKSGLVPVVRSQLFNATFYNDDQAFVRLKKKAITTDSLIGCMNTMIDHKNVSCFLEVTEINALIHLDRYKSPPTVKICKHLCYANPPNIYYFNQHSPYRGVVTEIVIRVEASGIRKMWINNDIGKMKRTKKQMNVGTNHHSLVLSLVYILTCGFVTSTLALVGEIMMFRLKNKKQMPE
ncbi:uncharacterized protein LOC122396985 [Colletes gigas]|uniref:uncharacterized protein LOC122396985 n=1 Tax=Colletes gigas TaxID=935657 RepID=UPI001C9B5503|nr:uncharacterized protein LOC122396985 [Colletes gigas]